MQCYIQAKHSLRIGLLCIEDCKGVRLFFKLHRTILSSVDMEGGQSTLGQKAKNSIELYLQKARADLSDGQHVYHYQIMLPRNLQYGD